MRRGVEAVDAAEVTRTERWDFVLLYPSMISAAETAVSVVVPAVVVAVVRTAVVVMAVVGSDWRTKVLSICRLYGPRVHSIVRTLGSMFHPIDAMKRIVLLLHDRQSHSHL